MIIFLYSLTEMLIHTVLNFVTDYKSFVFKSVYFGTYEDDSQRLVAEIVPRKNSQGICPECKRRCPTYDTADAPRLFEFVPLWNIAFYFSYHMRRVSCPKHGYSSDESLKITLFHALGKLPEPKFTHKFW